MTRTADVFLTALAPAIWGSSYIVTTELLPPDQPLTTAMLRALPAGLLLMLAVREAPQRDWLLRIFVLGALNFAIFWTLLFVAAYRLPGGVAATVGAVQPLLVIFLAHAALGAAIRATSVAAALMGMGGVALLVLSGDAAFDWIGVAAAAGGAASMAAGTVLSRKWAPPASPLTFAAWQLTAGGLLLLPVALVFEAPPAAPTATNLGGYLWLGLIGAALTYWLWFRGVARIEPAAVSALGFLSPATAILLGWLFLGERLDPPQIAGFVIVVAGVWLSQTSGRARRLATA